MSKDYLNQDKATKDTQLDDSLLPNSKINHQRCYTKDIGEFIHTEFGFEYEGRIIYKLLHQLGFSLITSRSKHPKQNKEVQRFLKAFLQETIRPHRSLPLDRIDVRFQDDAKFGQQNTTSRIWAHNGSRPRGY